MKIIVKHIIMLLLIAGWTSCKSKQTAITSTDTIKKPEINNDVNNIIKNHYASAINFKTAYFKANIDYDDGKKSLSLSSDIRIKKDEIILVSVKMLGIVMAKAIITPTQVRYYEKINGKFFEGDYKTLSNLLGTDLDFQKAQNILLGKAIDDLNKGQFKITQEEETTKLEDIQKTNIIKSYWFEPSTFCIKKQEITQISPSRSLKINYTDYKTYPEIILPGQLLIFALENNQKTNIAIAYKNASFNEEMTFPYSVPSGYEQIIIN